MIGYVLTLEHHGGWMFLGTDPTEVGKAVANEIEANQGLAFDEIDAMRIEAREFTQEEIDNMPEFEGW